MRRAALLLLLLVAVSTGQQDVRFVAIDVFIDTNGQPLAAYQLELTATKGALIVGVEGGASAAFKHAPYYDPAALKGGRIIIAAFTTDENPPKGRVRIARVHFQESGATKYTARPITAAAPGAERIDVTIDVVPYGEKR